jgi:hypothetical protein
LNLKHCGDNDPPILAVKIACFSDKLIVENFSPAIYIAFESIPQSGRTEEDSKKKYIYIEKYGEKLEYIFPQTKTCMNITKLCKLEGIVSYYIRKGN